jgi:hypothetical protein
MGEYYWHHTVLSCDEYHTFEPEPISGEAQTIVEASLEILGVTNETSGDTQDLLPEAGGASTGEQPPVCECGCHGSLRKGVEESCPCCAARPVSGTEPSLKAILDAARTDVQSRPQWEQERVYGKPSVVSGTEESVGPLVETIHKAYSDLVNERIPYIKGQMDHSVNKAAYELWCVIAGLERIAAAAPSLTPRCPKCRSAFVTIHFNVWSENNLHCRHCGEDSRVEQRQFFSAQEAGRES